ncbi:MAG: metallophosphoesterase family protein [Syntrophobacterales bacterium]|nr:MAG: metallophosphoesterase family protein [Syntrophobacterales bacterium]
MTAMKIGVISDTHLREPTVELERIALAHFNDVNMILHAGDFVDQHIVDFFQRWNLIAVCGNMDEGEIRSSLPQKRTIDVSGFKIGLIHGWGSPIGLEKRIKGELPSVDCLIYGHTHYPVNHKRGGLLFFNPGSPTRSLTGRNTIGILSLEKEIKGEIIKV